MVITTKEMYSEVYGILKALGNKYIDKLPKTVLKVITECKEENYNPEYSMIIPLKEQDINRKSLAMIALLHYNYWCETEEDRVKLKNILETNEEKHQKEMQEKYSNDKIFNKATTKIEEETISEKVDRFVEVSNQSTANIVEYKQSFFNKVIDKIKQWFNIFK